MRRSLTCLGLCLGMLCSASPAWSIVLEMQPIKRVVAGHVVSSDDKEITVRFKTPDGKEKVQKFDRSTIKIIHQVDRLRLGRLNKDLPKAYYDYAEELTKVKDDPEARELASRLFLIAAYLDSPKFGRDSLLKMSALADHPAKARRYRAMAFLLGSWNDPSLLKVAPTRVAPEAQGGLQSFRLALQHYRNGEINEAIKKASAKGAADYFTSAPGMMDQKSFIQACKDAVCTKCRSGKVICAACSGKKVIAAGFGFQQCTTCNGTGVRPCSSCGGRGLEKDYAEDSLETVLRAEVWALDQMLAADAAPQTAAAGWSSALDRMKMTPVRLLRLETISDYDPRRCLFRDGKWVAP